MPTRTPKETLGTHAVLGLILAVSGCQAAPAPSAASAKPPAEPPTAVKTHPPLMAEPAPCDRDALVPKRRRVQSAPGVQIMVTEIRAPRTKRGAVVLLHGAGSPASSIWDLHHDDYSVQRRLACEGFDTYGVDVRGYGGSSPAPKDASGQPAAVRAADVMVDVRAAVELALETSGVKQVDLLGWSWGCLVSGMYAGLHPESVRRLVLFAPVYDRRWPTRHAKSSEYKTVARDLFYKYHDPDRELRAVLDLHVAQLFEFAAPDGTLRLSNGPYMDIYGEDAPIWDPKKVRAPTLVMRGEVDRASQEAPAYRLFTHLTNAADRRYVVLAGAGHFAFRTKRYRAFQDEVVHFLTTDAFQP